MAGYVERRDTPYKNMRTAEEARANRYGNLEAMRREAVQATETFMSTATLLHTDSLDAEEQADVLALRAALIADLRTALGI